MEANQVCRAYIRTIWDFRTIYGLQNAVGLGVPSRYPSQQPYRLVTIALSPSRQGLRSQIQLIQLVRLVGSGA